MPVTSPAPRRSGGRRIVVVAVPDAQVLDVVGPAEVFSTADRLTGRPAARYTVEVVAPEAGPLRCAGGLTIVADSAMRDTEGDIDTLIVAGGIGVIAAVADPTVVGEIDRLAGRARRVASVCTGAFLLAATGRLDGRRATTHWASTARLAEMHPTVQVAPDQIFVRDGNVWTSAGVTAGIDLALALVARDHGRDVAADAARWLVVFLQRPGGQAQFSVPLAIAGLDTDVLAELQTWMVEHPDADLSVAALARRCHLSPRTFHRLVGRETGMTPGTWVEQIRVEAARRMLESTDLPVPAIARACGFGTVSTLYRAFERRLGVAPATYRHHFRAVPSPERSAS